MGANLSPCGLARAPSVTTCSQGSVVRSSHYDHHDAPPPRGSRRRQARLASPEAPPAPSPPVQPRRSDPLVVSSAVTDERTVLAVDVGGSHVKVLASNEQEKRRFESGPKLTAKQMVDGVLRIVDGWSYDVVSVGIPAPVRRNHVISEPVNLGKGWVDFDYEAAFGKPTRVVNDAAMQALGSYDGGRMLFLGLGTGLGSAMISGASLDPLELAHLPYRHDRTYEDYAGIAGLKRLGRKRWTKHVFKIATILKQALQMDYVV